MELLVSAFEFTVGLGVVHFLGGVLSVLALAASSSVVAGTAGERDRGLLTPGRAGAVAFTALLAAAGALGLFARWAFAVACVAFLMALLAVALRYGQGTSLQGYLDAEGREDEPEWWATFERGFRRYASTPGRQQNPLRRAVTRPSPRAADSSGGWGGRRSADVMAGGRL